MIRVCGPKDLIPEDAFVINTTSMSKDFGKGFSPFFLGPVDLWGGYTSLNVENAWQFSKVYKKHLDNNMYPSMRWFEWAEKGWTTEWAHRYPMGKGEIPQYSYWNGEKLNYIESRKRIYCPLYFEALNKDKTPLMLVRNALMNHREVWLWDFDGYDYHKLGMSLEDVLNNPKKKMGHAFVVAMILANDLCWRK